LLSTAAQHYDVPLQCYDANNNLAQLASFVPPPVDASPPIPAAVITVFPDGHEFFDQILLSALVVERKWTQVHG
jgi:hypothetical protein